MAFSSDVTVADLVLYSQYCNLRKDVVNTTSGHGHTGVSENGKKLSGACIGGSIDAGGYKIGNLGTPTASMDVANKGYADSLISTGYYTGVGAIGSPVPHNLGRSPKLVLITDFRLGVQFTFSIILLMPGMLIQVPPRYFL
jgi:hypothetical protein